MREFGLEELEIRKKGFWGSAVDLVKGFRSFYPTGGVSGTDEAGLMKLFNIGVGGKVSVSNDSAMALSAYLNSMVILSEDISSLPFNILKNTKDGSQIAGDHPVQKLLHVQPNNLCTPSKFWRIQVWRVAKTGNSINYIEREKEGNRPVAVWPLAPGEITEIKLRDDNTLEYHTLNNGIIKQADILHFSRLGDDIFNGKSIAHYQADMLGLGLSAQRYGKEFYEGGAQFDHVISHPGQLTDPAIDRIKKDVEMTRNAPAEQRKELQKTLVLQEGMKIEKMSFSVAEAEFFESQRHTAKSIAALFRIPLELLGMTENSNNSIAEQSILNYVKFGLTPWLVMFEQECNRKLFRATETGKYYTKFNLNAIQRGDINTRYEAYAKMYDRGIYSGNEIRDFEDMPHYEYGDKRYVNANNVMGVEHADEYAKVQIKKGLTDGGKGGTNK